MTAGGRPRSAAVIIGTASYQQAALADLPSVRANVRALHAMLTGDHGAALRAEEVVVVEDPADSLSMLRSIEEGAGTAEDLLLVYYAGHGLRPTDGELDDLYLTVPSSQEDCPEVTALPFELLRRALYNSRARKRVLILDCCFSGPAVRTRMGAPSPDLDIEGTYVMASAHPNQAALAPLGATYTAFTGTLLSVLGEGIPGAGDPLTLGEVFPEIRRRLAAARRPPPRQLNTETGNAIALTVNRAVPPSSASPSPTPAPRDGDKETGAGEDKFVQRGSVLALWRTWTLLCTGFAFGVPAYVQAARVAHPPPLLTFQVTCAYGLLALMAVLRHKIEVYVGPDGLRIGSATRTVAAHAWTSVAHVQIRTRRPDGRRRDLWLTLEPGAHGPGRNPLRRYNRRAGDGHQVRLTPLFGFSGPVIAQLDAALRTAAGNRWLPPAGRPVTDKRPAYYARPAAPLAALGTAGLLVLPLGLIGCLVTAGMWGALPPALLLSLGSTLPVTSPAKKAVPADLRIDATGLRVRDGRRADARFWPWSCVRSVGCERSHDWENRPGHLVIRTTESSDSPPVLRLPLRRLRGPADRIDEALERFAGHRWSPDLHCDDGVLRDDAEALVLQGRYNGARTVAVLVGIDLLVLNVGRWLGGLGVLAHGAAAVFLALCVLQAEVTIGFLLLQGPCLDRFTLRMDTDGITVTGRGRRRPAIGWALVRSVQVDKGRVVLWPSREGALSRAFQRMAGLGGGFILCRFTGYGEYVDVHPRRLERAVARFAGHRITLVGSSGRMPWAGQDE
ncbi:caspase domain-containing protein [Kitasatospora sp. NPDC088783]|uniref:caspase family protein n=1 Tax=Kitasatospora sp. NPDC088783 TaxID=3364077 RepID=UPI00381CE0AF